MDTTVAPEAVAQGPSLSPSRAGDFLTCALLYRFRAIDRLPEPPSPEAVRGTVIHRVLELLYDRPAAERTPAEAARLLAPAWAEVRAAEPERSDLFPDDPDGDAERAWLAGADAVLARYFDLEDPRRLEPAAREVAVSARLPSGLTVRGIVDRIDERSDGALRIVDYKSGRAPAPEWERRALFQLRFYALVLQHERGTVPRALRMVYLGSGEVLDVEVEPHDLALTERKVDAVWAAIQEATTTDTWEPTPSAACRWCSFRDRCPAID